MRTEKAIGKKVISSVSRHFDIERFDYFGYERGVGDWTRMCEYYYSILRKCRLLRKCYYHNIVISMCIRLFTTKVVQCIYRVRLTENYYYRQTRRTEKIIVQQFPQTVVYQILQIQKHQLN